MTPVLKLRAPAVGSDPKRPILFRSPDMVTCPITKKDIFKNVISYGTASIIQLAVFCSRRCCEASLCCCPVSHRSSFHISSSSQSSCPRYLALAPYFVLYQIHTSSYAALSPRVLTLMKLRSIFIGWTPPRKLSHLTARLELCQDASFQNV